MCKKRLVIQSHMLIIVYYICSYLKCDIKTKYVLFVQWERI